MAEVVRDFMGNMVCSGKKNDGTYNPYNNSDLDNLLCGLSRQDNNWDYVVLPKNKIRNLEIEQRYDEMPIWNLETIIPWCIRKEDLEKVFPKQDRKEENKMADTNKILYVYEDIESKRIRECYDNKIQETEKESGEAKIAQKVREFALKELKKAFPDYDETKQRIIVVDYDLQEQTKKTIEDLNKERRKDLTRLDERLQEIKAMLELAQTFDEKMKVLKAYDVVDNKGVMKK